VARSVSRLYLDACCIVYLIEAAEPFHRVVAGRLVSHGRDPSARVVTSRLSRLECRTRPLRDAKADLLSAYDLFFASSRLDLVEILGPVVERATDPRARYGLRTPDALHLATAIEERAAVFLTGDATLKRCAEVHVEVLSAAEI
jgi:uncharacterized protein